MVGARTRAWREWRQNSGGLARGQAESECCIAVCLSVWSMQIPGAPRPRLPPPPPSLLFSTNQTTRQGTHTLPTHLISILLLDLTSPTPPQTQTNPLTNMSAVTKKTAAAKKAAPAASGPSYRKYRITDATRGNRAR